MQFSGRFTTSIPIYFGALCNSEVSAGLGHFWENLWVARSAGSPNKYRPESLIAARLSAYRLYDCLTGPDRILVKWRDQIVGPA